MTSKWNYRVVRTRCKTPSGEDTETVYQIHSAYYDKSGKKVVGISEHACGPLGETPQELREDLKRFERAFTMPIIDSETLEPIIDARYPTN